MSTTQRKILEEQFKTSFEEIQIALDSGEIDFEQAWDLVKVATKEFWPT